MEMTYSEEAFENGWKPSRSLEELIDFRNNMELYFLQRGLQGKCKVHVSRSGKWFVLTGYVDSQWTRAILFSMVPRTANGKHVIDKLHVDSAAQQGERVS